MKISVISWALAALSFAHYATAEPVRIERGGHAALVVPIGAEAITRYAAEELVYHAALAADVTLHVYTEGSEDEFEGPRIYLGPTRAAARAGIDVTRLCGESFVLRTMDGQLFVAAREGPGDPLSVATATAGVLWGVYELIERALGVRWLWPGDLGVLIPACGALAFGPYDETVPPRFVQRHLRPGIGPRGFAVADERLAFTETQRDAYARDQAVFLRRHRMGRSENTYFSERKWGSGHAFGDWWARFGADHPGWFRQGPDGRRGPENPAKPDQVPMCVSNPALHVKIVELWAKERAERPGQPLGLGIGENDTSAACVCAACLSWDAPPVDVGALPGGLERSFLPVQAGTRYARFAQAVHALATGIDPEVRVHFYAYLNYFWPPGEGLTLDPNITIGFVPWFRWAGWFPRTEAEHEWIKQQWIGWQQTGASVYYRPNWFLDGYTMPLAYAHQFADAFQFYARHGMIGTDFDSLQGMWATQGPTVYLLARLHVRPEAPVETLLDEYYAAFGPAKEAVRAYFQYWEDYARDNRARAAEAIKSRRGGHFRRYALYAQVAHELYPPPVFAPGFALLDAAREAAKDTSKPVYAERIAFLRVGLEHAQLCAQTAATVNSDSAAPEERAAALGRLRDFRQDAAHLGIANMDRAGIIETDSWADVPGFDMHWPSQSAPHVESLFRDSALDHGFHLSALRSSMQPLEIARVLARTPEADPQWRLAQWGTRFNLAGAAVVDGTRGERTMANAGQALTVYPGGLSGEGVRLTVHGGAQYGGHLREMGEAWPHLLIEQAFPGGLHLRDYRRLSLRFSFRILEARAAVHATLDPSLHTAHINAFFTLHNLREGSPGQGDMIWFGIPLFDARHDIPPGHQAVDAGQADASGRFICTMEGGRFWEAPTGGGAWHAFDQNLLPLMREALDASHRNGHCRETALEDLAVTSFNLGWEVPGPYDCSAQVKGLSLEAERHPHAPGHAEASQGG